MEEIVKLIKNGVVQYPITKPEAVIDETGITLDQKIKDIVASTDILGKNIIEITHDELVEKAKNGELIPEQRYRIIDYKGDFKFDEDEVIGAGHQFDIIVTAKNNSELYEEARAAKHEGDTYFANSNLNEWKLWYEIGSTGGFNSGRIKRMIDEYDNDVLCDFKNTKFKTSSWVPQYKDKFEYCYVFTNDETGEDSSIEGKIERVILQGRYAYRMNHINFFFNSAQNVTCNYSENNIFYDIVWNSTLLNCKGNTFEQSVLDSTLINCENSTFKGTYSINSNIFTNIKDKIIHTSLDATPYKVFSAGNIWHITDSGKIIPSKHPDLSTQPSVLPYMCMDNNVFEYLIPYSNVNTLSCTLEYDKPLILSCDIIGVGIKINCDVVGYVDNILTIEPSKEISSEEPLYVKISYTSLEKRNSCGDDEYGYGDYGSTY